MQRNTSSIPAISYAARARGGGMTTNSATATSSASSADTSSKPQPQTQRLQLLPDRVVSASSGGNNGRRNGGGGPVAEAAPARLPDACRLPRVGVGGGGGGGQACAACKYQRRKCNPDCALAPYFPADDQRRFLNVHRLFGVSNIQKTLRNTTPDLHQDAMRAIIFEAEARAQDPVGGAARIVAQLKQDYDAITAYLATVLQELHHRQQIALCSQQQQPTAANHANNIVMADDDPDAMLPAGAGQFDPVANALYVDQHIAGEAAVVQPGGNVLQEQYVLNDEAQVQQQPPQNPYGYFYYTTANDDGSSHAWRTDVDNLHQYNGGEANPPPMGIGEQLQQHCQIEAAPPFVGAIDLKPDRPTTTTMGGNGSVSHAEQPEEKVSAAAAPAQCQLELGFSSNAWQIHHP
ncbi:hypothetical protein GUJ93_ZPchr0009g457 [Zizania palustris]|uniref:LOB domain-containing protein n=1 Tax=Zizania palustris TaxID=103762 RepID=A0A8J5V330_ZIZPA|nr:hypothetical protein GUJ93_ZPchr0009g457 [Zizania palustris]